MESFKTKGVDLNQLDLQYEDFKTRVLNGKFVKNFTSIFNITFATLHNLILPNEEPIYNRHRLTKEGNIPMPTEPINDTVLEVIKVNDILSNKSLVV